MPPKAKKKEEPLPEVPPELDLEVPALKAKILALREEVATLQATRVQAATDRDAVERFFDVTKRELREAELAVLAKRRDSESAADNHRIEVKVYQQKVKHLEYEHAAQLGRIREEGKSGADEEEHSHLVREARLRANKQQLRSRIREAEEANAEAIRQMKLMQEKNLQRLGEEFDRSLEALRTRYEQRLGTLRADLALRAKVEIHEVEERRNLHIHQLTVAHEEAFAEMRRYYNDITKSNLELINQLKAKIAEASGKAAANQKMVLEIAEENKRLSEPLQHALAERASLEADLKDATRDRQSLAYARVRLGDLRRQLADLQAAHTELEAKYATTQQERDELYGKFEATVRAAQARAEARTAALERRLGAAEATHAERAAQTMAVLQAAQLDPAALKTVAARLDTLLEGRNAQISELRAGAARLAKAHDDALRTLTAKLAELGVPPPLASAGQTLLGATGAVAAAAAATGGGAAVGLATSGPAGLVAVPAV